MGQVERLWSRLGFSAVVLAVGGVLTAGPWSYVAVAVAGVLMLVAVRLADQPG